MMRLSDERESRGEERRRELGPSSFLKRTFVFPSIVSRLRNEVLCDHGMGAGCSLQGSKGSFTTPKSAPPRSPPWVIPSSNQDV